MGPKRRGGTSGTVHPGNESGPTELTADGPLRLCLGHYEPRRHAAWYDERMDLREAGNYVQRPWRLSALLHLRASSHNPRLPDYLVRSFRGKNI